MIMGPENTCPKCGVEAPVFWAQRQHIYMCVSCQRLYNPPYMTLVRFNQGSIRKLWNLEIGEYEDFDKVEDINLCDWMVRSHQVTPYSIVPRVTVNVYHLEYFGDLRCGRCINYPFFESDQTCLSRACQKMAKPFKSPKDIQYPPERSKYVQWMRF